ncbi:TraB family protein [Cesiribacter andamanensis AMV16]|uniref:TraB family protein n=1 Tax=Cesiribacter andamanensis AMV16 TaxID=1279009 RepID=M7N325_9BACT|nr:TraB family protein [Cesiribacter andamanensis AMV16]
MASYEAFLSQQMAQQIKPVTGLESARDQLRVLDAIPYQEQARLLLEAVQDYQKLKDGYWNMVVSYKNQDLQSLYYVVREVSMGMKDYEKLLLTDRNRRWMPAIETMARQQASFFAVGAAHLPGENGLINLLRRRGYKVEPVVE